MRSLRYDQKHPSPLFFIYFCVVCVGKENAGVVVAMRHTVFCIFNAGYASALWTGRWSVPDCVPTWNVGTRSMLNAGRAPALRTESLINADSGMSFLA